MNGADWYECAVVLYKSLTPGVKDLTNDDVAAVNAIRGKEIGGGAKCPTAFNHDVCGGGNVPHTCGYDGFITNILTVPVDGNSLAHPAHF